MQDTEQALPKIDGAGDGFAVLGENAAEAPYPVVAALVGRERPVRDKEDVARVGVGGDGFGNVEEADALEVA
ncbi:MAG: hypothetical protein IJ678_07360, partial [Kiritimatiellae bacterium]|nr:hypothetical protein [Kiritimatiellia bacterium]